MPSIAHEWLVAQTRIQHAHWLIAAGLNLGVSYTCKQTLYILDHGKEVKWSMLGFADTFFAAFKIRSVSSRSDASSFIWARALSSRLQLPVRK